MIRFRTSQGFTLVEVALAISVLVIGLTAAISLFFVGTRWARDMKRNYTAYHTLRSVHVDPALIGANDSVLDPPSAAAATSANGKATASGWVNRFYVVREVKDDASIAGGTFQTVVLSAYMGGTDVTGELVARQAIEEFIP